MCFCCEIVHLSLTNPCANGTGHLLMTTGWYGKPIPLEIIETQNTFRTKTRRIWEAFKVFFIKTNSWQHFDIHLWQQPIVNHHRFPLHSWTHLSVNHLNLRVFTYKCLAFTVSRRTTTIQEMSYGGCLHHTDIVLWPKQKSSKHYYSAQAIWMNV